MTEFMLRFKRIVSDVVDVKGRLLRMKRKTTIRIQDIQFVQRLHSSVHGHLVSSTAE